MVIITGLITLSKRLLLRHVNPMDPEFFAGGMFSGGMLPQTGHPCDKLKNKQ
jgi:hypothetical protein